MAPPKIPIDPAILERARALYENGTSLDEIGLLMGVSGQTVRNRAIGLGWSRSRPTRPVAEHWPDAPPPMREPTPEDAQPDALVARLCRMAAREMLRTETYNHSPAEAARTLAMLAKTVHTLCAMQRGQAPVAEPSLEQEMEGDAVRRDVARRLEELYEQVGEEEFLRRTRDVHPIFARATLRVMASMGDGGAG